MDRSDALNGHEGPLCAEIKTALYNANVQKDILDYIYGLGGREITPADIETVYKDLADVAKGKPKDKVTYLGVRE
jgi:pyruvate ferredoxin oxidoreductase alpha subunit